MTGAILTYCGGHRTLARPVGLGFYKMRQVWRLHQGDRGRMSTPTAPHIAPNVPLVDARPDLKGAETRCPVRERDGSRCEAEAGMWSYGHTCSRHSEQLRRGRKLVLVNGTRLDKPWSMPGRFGWWISR